MIKLVAADDGHIPTSLSDKSGCSGEPFIPAAVFGPSACLKNRKSRCPCFEYIVGVLPARQEQIWSGLWGDNGQNQCLYFTTPHFGLTHSFLSLKWVGIPTFGHFPQLKVVYSDRFVRGKWKPFL